MEEHTATSVLTSLWSIKLHYKFIESSQDGDLMLTLNAMVEGKGNYTGLVLPRTTQSDTSHSYAILSVTNIHMKPVKYE